VEVLNEQEDPAAHLAPPKVPLDEIEITLSRWGAMGAYPNYSLTVSGTVASSYDGKSNVDVKGSTSTRYLRRTSRHW
jgi:hypothetical protein